MDNIENELDFPENIFDDANNDNGVIEEIIDYNDIFMVEMNDLIDIMNEPINEEAVNVICEMDEDVPLKKKPCLAFQYNIIEN